MLLTMMATTGRMWGQSTSTYSLTPDQSSTGSSATSYITTLTTFTYNNVSWKMNQWNPKTLQIRTNQSSATSEFRFYNTSAIPGKITQVVLTFSDLTLSNTTTTGFMFVGGTSEVTATTGGTNGTWNSTNKTITWTPGANDNFTYFAFYQNGKVATGTNKLATADAIVVTYETGSGSTYSVTYNANGATSGDVPEDDNEYESGDEVTVLDNTGNLAKTGNVWSGWNTNASGTGSTYQADDTFEITASTTLYAKWTPKSITNLAYTGTPNKTDYFEGDIFDPTGLTVTATYNDASTEVVTSQVTWTPSPLTAGTTSVTGSFMGQEIEITGLTVAGANITLSTANSPFTSISSSNTYTEQVTLDGIEYQNCGGYKYNSYLSINKSINGYLGNNTKLCGSIKRIVVEFSSDVISKFTMYEGATALSETTSITPTTNGNVATYTFSGNTGYFKYKLTTTGTFCNIVSIKIYLNDCITYTVSGIANPAVGGTVTVAESPLSEGDATTVTATPNEGYQFTSWAVTGAGSTLSSTTDNPTTFTMGTADATVTATFTQVVTYDIVVNDATEHGSIEADKEYAAAGETVTITATADNGFELDEWIVEDEDSTPIAVTGTNPATFVMPAKDVLVSATFTAKPTYAITTVVSPENTGTIKTDATAWEGKTVLVLVEPETGYSLTNIVVGKTADLTVTTAITGNVTDGFTFTMPAYPVTVTATFAAADVLTGSEVYAAMPNSKAYKEWILVKTYATYKGQSNDVRDFIQLRKQTSSGIVTTTSTGYARKVSVTYADSNTNARYLTIYGKNTPYEGPADLYDDNKKGTSLGTITYNTNDVSGELTITSDYQYIGLLASGAMYFEPIIITWEPVTFYDVIYDEVQTGGTISVNPTTAAEGETITLTAAPAEHYEFTSWIVKDEDENPIAVTGTNPATFLMPASDVTVEATFTALSQYDITIPAAIEDYIMVDATGNKAYAGETVTISVVDTPAGKVLSTLTVIGDTSGDEIEISPEVSASIDEYTFEMPAENVTINATFGDLPQYTVTFYVNGTLDNNLTINNITPGNSINLPASSTLIPEGYSLIGWATEGSTVAVDNPYIPANSMALYSLLQDNNAQVTYSYVKVTESLADWSGDYLIVYTTDNLAFDGSLETLDAPDNTIAVNITNNCIAANATTDASKFTIEEYEHGYSIKSASNKYIGNASNSNGLTASDNQMENTITYNNGDIDIVGTKGAYLRYNSSSGQERFRYFKSSSYTSQEAIQLYKRTANDVPSFNTITEVSGTTTIGDDIPATTCVIVENGAVLTFNGENQGTAANLVIEDGGQLVVSNPVAATMDKTYTKPSSWGNNSKGVNGWYLISSPVGTVNTSAVANLTPANSYDLYAYNEPDMMWYNAQGAYHPFSQLVEGEGYLYSSKDGADAAYSGTVFCGALTKTLSYEAANAEMKGWNLLGNPYSHNITWANLTPTGVNESGYYTLGFDGSWSAEPSTTAVIKPMQGFLVQATSAGAKVVFNNIAASAKARSNNDFIAFTVANDQYEDVTYAMFEEGLGLNKINHRNSDIPMVYIPQNGQNYAIATMSDETDMFNLNFKAMTTGKYTLSYKAEGKYDYLHVIDRITGEDVDMLLDGEYSFMASAGDNDARFIVKLRYDANGNFDSDIFAYQNGNDVIVNGEGELQMFDLTGRMVANTMVNGVQTVNVPTQGVYIFRLVGNDVKTQKIVVR